MHKPVAGVPFNRIAVGACLVGSSLRSLAAWQLRQQTFDGKPPLRTRELTRKTLCVALVSGIVGGCGAERPASPEAGRIVEVEIPAPSLTGNLLGDPDVQPISVYLPPSYDASPGRRYPVIYLLHGFNGTNRTWMIDPALLLDGPSSTGIEDGYGVEGKLRAPLLDSLIDDGAIPEVVLVAPNGRNAYKHSFYVNSSVAGNWENYVVDDVVG